MAFAGGMVLSDWSIEGVNDAVDLVTSVGLLVAAVWAGTVGVETMKASRNASRAAIEANEQASIDSHNATRPYVDARVVEGLAGTTEFDLVIRNVGKSAARDLTIECATPVARDDDVTKAVLELFSTQRTVFPDTSIRAMWQLGETSNDPRTVSTDARGERVTGKMGMPDSAALSIKYRSSDGMRTYTETTTVRCDRSGLWPVPEQGHEMPPVGEQPGSRHILSVLRSIARHLGDANR